MRTRVASKLDRPTEEQQPPRPCKKRKAGRLVVQTMDELASLLAEVEGETTDIKRVAEACEGIVQACKRVAEACEGVVPITTTDEAHERVVQACKRVVQTMQALDECTRAADETRQLLVVAKGGVEDWFVDECADCETVYGDY
jgi:hypothetical protein